MSLKFTGKFCVMTMKNDAKIEEELICQFKTDMKNLTNFEWQWKMMQKLERNWFVSSKLTWGIWRILTPALENLKNFHFNGLLLSKAYNVWAKKSIGEFCLMVLNIDTTFEGKLTCAFKNDMRNLANLYQSMFESLKFGTLLGSFYPK